MKNVVIAMKIFSGRSSRQDARSILRVAGKPQSDWRCEYFSRGALPRCPAELSHANNQSAGRSCWSTAGWDQSDIGTVSSGSDLRSCFWDFDRLGVVGDRRLQRLEPHNVSRDNKASERASAVSEPFCLLSIHVLGLLRAICRAAGCQHRASQLELRDRTEGLAGIQIRAHQGLHCSNYWGVYGALCW